jgi:ribosomal protein S18 acetylase RimI-like enzyme
MKNDLLDLISKYNNIENGLRINVPIEEYINKLLEFSTLITYQESHQIMGFIAYYKNDPEKKDSFLTMLLIDETSRNKKIGQKLLDFALSDVSNSNFKIMNLEVLKSNNRAIEFYKKNKFKIQSENGEFYKMSLCLD